MLKLQPFNSITGLNAEYREILLFLKFFYTIRFSINYIHQSKSARYMKSVQVHNKIMENSN